MRQFSHTLASSSRAHTRSFTRTYQNRNLSDCFSRLKWRDRRVTDVRRLSTKPPDESRIGDNRAVSRIRAHTSATRQRTHVSGQTCPAPTADLSRIVTFQTSREFTPRKVESQDGVGFGLSECESANRKTASVFAFVDSRSQSPQSQYSAGVPPPNVPLVNVL